MALTALSGVRWRTATVILRFVFPEQYPIADVNASGTPGLKVPAAFKLEVWLAYRAFCQSIAEQARVDLRTLDRALWGYWDAKKRSSGSRDECRPGVMRRPPRA
mgnify:CR=1 FL=1